jgi:G3E family GTPase
MEDARLPVSLITGFLGAGKTTLLNHLLATPAGRGAAVVVNEFGEVGVDHLLVSASGDRMVELPNGCLCCAVRSDLVETLFGLFVARTKGEIPPFDRVVIETSGLADPGPILLAFFTEEAVARRYRIDRVVTVADAVNLAPTLRDAPEALAQVAAADALFLSKTDIATPAERAGTAMLLARTAPGVPVTTDPAAVWTLSVTGTPAPQPAVWGRARHAPAETRVLTFDTALRWQDIAAWAAWLRREGAAILRAKGVVRLDGRDDALVVQVVQGIAYPPVFVPDPGEASRIVFIHRPGVAGLVDISHALLTGRTLPDECAAR